MTHDIKELEWQLGRAPEDWSVRLSLIEEYIWRDNKDEARRLVRKAPDDVPLPNELQHRLHRLMTIGKDAIERHMAPLKASDIEELKPVPSKPVIEPVPAKVDRSPKNDDEEVIELVAANADDLLPEITDDGLVKVMHPSVTSAPPVLKSQPSQRWLGYEGDFILADAAVDPDFVSGRDRGSSAPQKISAFSFALLVHVVLFLSLTLVIVSYPRPQPPQLTVVSPKTQTDLVIPPKRLSKDPDPRPSAAAMLPANLVSADINSEVAIPEFDQTQNLDATVMLDGFQPTGVGMSFAGDGMESSQVNFFGISSGGRRIVFIVDATSQMLVDEKGGMFAYDKVKNEIAAMLGGLKSGTVFNILLYDGRRLASFRDKLVPAYPSNIGGAVRWLDPLNREYENLGLARTEYAMTTVKDEIDPILAKDIAHYPMAIQKAFEWEANTIFCIASGYQRINRSLTPEMEEMRRKNPGTPGTIDPAEQKAWRDAVARTREWLRKENDARKEKGLAPKVVTNFSQLVSEITGATPPRPTGGTPPAGGMANPPPYTSEEILDQVKSGIRKYYVSDIGASKPSVNLVLFLGEDEELGPQEEHFKELTRKNGGKLKVLRGLAALTDVTGK